MHTLCLPSAVWRPAHLGLLLALAAPACLARPPGTNCPDSPVEASEGVDALLFPNLTPGSTVSLGGTDASSNGDLVGATIKNLTLSYSWTTGAGTASGTLHHTVTNAIGNNKCVFQHQVAATPASTLRICAVRLTQFLYPLPHAVYAEYRTDSSPPGDVKATQARRSPSAGKQVRFKLKHCLNPGQLSETLILVTTAPQVARDAYIRLEAEDGSLSPPLKVFNPLMP